MTMTMTIAMVAKMVVARWLIEMNESGAWMPLLVSEMRCKVRRVWVSGIREYGSRSMQAVVWFARRRGKWRMPVAWAQCWVCGSST